MRRIYEELVREHLAKLRQMIFLMGPRQVGKTTVSLEAASQCPRHFYFNWDNPAERLLFMEGSQAIASQIGLEELGSDKPVLIFDEIHKFGKWKNFLKGFFDLYEKVTRIIVTGSARLNVYKRGGDSLMGRYFYYRIHPLSVAEIVSPYLIDTEIRLEPQKISDEDWEALLKHGGFPEPFVQRSENFSRRLQSMRKDQLFREDIRDGTRIQELAQLELLAELLRKQAAQSMDYQSLAKKVGVSADTIRRWIEVLKSFYFCFSIQPWSKNIARSLLKEPKLYLWDWSLIEDEGHRNENLVASHLLKAVHFWTDRGLGEYGLYYLRTKDQREVDFIVTKNKKPWFNIVFAFVAFLGIWISGGQEKPFNQYTNVIGYIDPQSKLYTSGVRPGDELLCVDGKTVDGYQDLLVSLLMEEKAVALKGFEVNYFSGKKEPFSVALPPPSSTVNNVTQAGVAPAQYLIFDDYTSPVAPLRGSGIQKGDRIVWVDGELIFSNYQLSAILNDPKTVLTIERDGRRFLAQVPRMKISDLRLQNDQRNELDDWQHEAGLKSKIAQLYFIPYLVNHQGVVEKSLSFMNTQAEEVKPVDQSRNPLTQVLQTGDQIVAVDGTPVSNSIELLSQIQKRNALIIVQRGQDTSINSWKTADADFESSFKPNSLMKIISSIGSAQPTAQNENLVLLTPVSLKPLSELDLEPSLKAQVEADYKAEKKAIEKIENGEVREAYLTALEQKQKRLMLGASLQDRQVSYNPPPTSLFFTVFEQTWKTLTNLVSGSISPKALAGPVGIVKALQSSWSTGIKDALFWLGFVSLNLAILNLLPIPVLDGGHIVFASIEAATGKPIKAKTMEKFIIPFVILLVVLFIYLTYQDIIRLLTQFF